MVNRTAIWLVILSLSVSIISSERIFTPSPASAESADATISKRVYAKANPAVVTVRCNGSTGSGFMISSDGYIITNAHVVRGEAAVVTVEMANGTTEMPADVVGFGKNKVDLALLKINRHTRFPTLQLAKSKPTVGDDVYAIGSPFGESNNNTFTRGIVSAIRQNGQYIQPEVLNVKAHTS